MRSCLRYHAALLTMAAMTLLGQSAASLAQSLVDEYGPKMNGAVFAIETDQAGRTLVGGAFTVANGVSTQRLVRLHGDGSTDVNFQAAADSSVRAILPLNDQVVVGGAFGMVNGQPRLRLAILDGAGNLVAGTAPQFNGEVFALVKNALDDSYFVGGAFTQVNSQARLRIAKLSGGNLLPGFVPVAATGTVRALAMQADGKVLVTGSVNRTGAPANEGPVYRLNADGSHDPSFSFLSAGAGDVGYHVSVMSNGKIIVAGDFVAGKILRLHADGSVDSDFNPPVINGLVRDVAPQADGRLVIAGDFTGLSLRDRIARLQEGGQLDGAFAPLSSPNGIVHALAVAHNGSVVVGGNFTEITGLTRLRMARISYRGLLDASLDAQFTGGDVEVLAAQPDGKMYAGGSFTHVNGELRPYLVRLNAHGSIDGAFNVTPNNEVRAIAVLPDHVLVAGAFNTINGKPRLRIAKLTRSGALVSTFNPAVENGTLHTLALQSDGKILLGGSFTAINGVARQAIARLNEDGSLDPGFVPAPLSNFTRVRAISIRADDVFMSIPGFIYLGGETVGTNRMERLFPDGSLDSSFLRINTSTLFSMRTTSFGTVNYGALAGNGTCSHFLTVFTSSGVGCLARLSAPAISFITTAGNDYLVGGGFADIGGFAQPGLAKIITAGNPGELSDAFDFPISGGTATVNSVLLQDDGKLTFAGNFTAAGAQTRSSIARSSEGFAEGTNLTPVSRTSGISTQWNPLTQTVRFIPGAMTPQLERAPTLLLSNSCCLDAAFTPTSGARATLNSLADLAWDRTSFVAPTRKFYLRWRYQTTDARGGVSLFETPITRFIPRSPVLVFSPAATDVVSFPTGPAGLTTARITVAPSLGGGGSTSLRCALQDVVGPGAFSNLRATPSNFEWIADAGQVDLDCARAAQVTTGTLSCLESYSDERAPTARLWGLVCPSASGPIDLIFRSGFENL